MKYKSETFIQSAQTPIVTVRQGLTRQIMGYNDEIMQVKVIFGEEMVGQRPPLHSHPHTQSSIVLSGKFEVHVGEEVQILGPGDGFCAPPNVPHEAYCLEPGVLIDGFSPVREDFLG